MKRSVSMVAVLSLIVVGAASASVELPLGAPSAGWDSGDGRRESTKTSGSAQAEGLLDAHVRWRGGREALRSLTFLERRGDIRIGSAEGTFRTVGARDGWLRYDLRLDGVQQVEAVTPEGGWRWLNGDVTDLSDERIAAVRSSIDEMFARHLLLERGYEVEYVGGEDRNGNAYEVLRLRDEARSIDLFLLPDGTLHWTRKLDQGSEAWTRLDDWRLVDGVRFAFRADHRPDDAEGRQLTEWKEVIVDGEIDPGEFRRPPGRRGRGARLPSMRTLRSMARAWVGPRSTALLR